MPAPLKPTEKEDRLRIGRYIRRQRNLREWTLEKLAWKVKVKDETTLCAQTLSKIERGEHTLKPELLGAIAAALDVDLGALIKPEEGLPWDAKIENYVWDKHVPEPTIIASQALMREAVNKRVIESHEFGLKLKWRFPPLLYHHADWQPSHIETAADNIRDHWRLGEGPIASVTFSLEMHGVTTMLDYTEKSPVVFAGTVKAKRVLRWLGREPVSPDDIAHYRHRMLSALIHSFGVGRGLQDAEARRRATKIAGAVLLPRTAIYRAFSTGGTSSNCNRITADGIIAIASIFGIPLKDALNRICGVTGSEPKQSKALRNTLRGKQLLEPKEAFDRQVLLPPF